MKNIVIGSYAFQVNDLLLIIGILIGIPIILWILGKIFRKKEDDSYKQSAFCKSCGWTGQVSRYAGRCPKCNQPLGEQKIKEFKK
jgi:hypothetical protein